MATCDYAPYHQPLSQSDLSLLAKSFKDEKFCEIFREYANELCDPEKRQQYESELKEWENQRGVDVVFVQPSPGLCVRGRARGEPVWVNICASHVIEKPSFEVVNEGQKRGQKWSFPHALPPPRVEVVTESKRKNKKGNTGTVHDVIFHPDTLHLAARSDVMHKTVLETAVESLKEKYNVEVSDIEVLSDLKYAGMATKSVIRRVVNQKLLDQHEKDNVIGQDSLLRRALDERTSNASEFKNTYNDTKENRPLSPVYKLKHVSKLDLQDFSIPIIPSARSPTRPQALAVDVQLPGVSRAAQVDAHVEKQTLHLSTDSTPKYKLELALPYAVDEDSGTAKFDVATQQLSLVFPVMPDDSKGNLSPHSPSCDSGIECEVGYRTNSDGDNSSEVSVSSQDDVGGDHEDSFVFESVSPPPPNKALITPTYTFTQDLQNLYLVLHCGNVLPNSISITHPHQSSIRVELSSIGSGQTLLHYGLTLVTPDPVPAGLVTYDVREGEVKVTVPKGPGCLWRSCEVVGRKGMTTSVTLDLPEKQAVEVAGDKEENKEIHVEEEADLQKEAAEGLEDKTETEEDEEEGVSCTEDPVVEVKEECTPKPPRSPRVCRTVSLCEGEEPNVTTRGPTCSWPRGILKRRCRSLSESAVSSHPSLAKLGSSLDLVCDSLEEGGEEDEDEEYGSVASSVEKKSVRFNEVVSRQLFRTDRSIKMERIKNAKRIEYNEYRKKRQRERRASESDRESSDSGRKKDGATTTEEDTDNATTTDTCDVEEAKDINDRVVAKKKNKKNRKKNKDSNATSDKDSGGEGKNKKKNKKSKKFEPSNTFIFQLDIDG